MTSNDVVSAIRQAAVNVLENLGEIGSPQPVSELNQLRNTLAEHRDLKSDPTTDQDVLNLYFWAQAMLLNTGIGVAGAGPRFQGPPPKSNLDKVRAALEATAHYEVTAFKR